MEGPYWVAVMLVGGPLDGHVVECGLGSFISARISLAFGRTTDVIYDWHWFSDGGEIGVAVFRDPPGVR